MRASTNRGMYASVPPGAAEVSTGNSSESLRLLSGPSAGSLTSTGHRG